MRPSLKYGLLSSTSPPKVQKYYRANILSEKNLTQKILHLQNL